MLISRPQGRGMQMQTCSLRQAARIASLPGGENDCCMSVRAPSLQSCSVLCICCAAPVAPHAETPPHSSSTLLHEQACSKLFAQCSAEVVWLCHAEFSKRSATTYCRWSRRSGPRAAMCCSYRSPFCVMRPPTSLCTTWYAAGCCRLRLSSCQRLMTC